MFDIIVGTKAGKGPTVLWPVVGPYHPWETELRQDGEEALDYCVSVKFFEFKNEEVGGIKITNYYVVFVITVK